MTDLHPILPTEELVRQWNLPLSREELLVIAYRAGSDKELEACLEWISKHCRPGAKAQLLAARRPKPLSETDWALERLKLAQEYIDVEPIYRALQRLKKLEESTND